MTVTALLAQAAGWRLLSALLERPRDGWRKEILALARETADGELAACARRIAEDASEGAYLAVLGPGGAASPREVAYRPDSDPAAILAQLHALYQAFAYRPAAEDPPDHIAVELGFAGFLVLKRAFAEQCDDAASATLVAEGLALFRAEHLDAFAAALAERLRASDSYLRPLSAPLAAWLNTRDRQSEAERSRM